MRPQPAAPSVGTPPDPIDLVDPSEADVFRFHRVLNQARSYVEDHMDGDLSLAVVSRAVGVERKYFCVLFRRQAGIGFKKWTLLVRLHRAMELFRSTDDSVTDVAFHVGFQSLRTFERAFSRFTGHTPRDYRRQAHSKFAISRDAEDLSHSSG